MFGFLLLLMVFAFLLVFAVQNAGVVAVSFLLWKFEASLSIIIIIFFVAGAFSAAAAFWVRKMKKKPSAASAKNNDAPGRQDENRKP